MNELRRKESKMRRIYLKQLDALLESDPYLFNQSIRKKISKGSGIYAIYERKSYLVYIGRSSNLRRRLFRDHFGGERRRSAFRKNLSSCYKLKSERKITNYITEKCSFKYMELTEPKHLEYYGISVLKPKLNR
jgi:excinuclease UvrABC nuclease subunit